MAVNLPNKATSQAQTGHLQGPQPAISQETSAKKSKVDSAPALPPSADTASAKAVPTAPASLIARCAPAVAGAMMALMLGTGCAAAGPRLDDPAFTTPPTEHVREFRIDTGAFSRAMDELEDRRSDGKVSVDDVAKARAVLYRAYVLGETASAPKDERGKITIDSVLNDLRKPANGTVTSKGDQIMDQLSAQLERRMRISARDMAKGNFKPIEGMPGYKQIPDKDVQSLLKDAFKRIPIGELPFGAELTNALSLLPGTNDFDVAAHSYNELQKELKGDARQVLKDHFGDFVDDHKIELGITAFAAITGLRASSPEAAKLMDQLKVKIRVWKSASEDGTLRSSGRLVYRDAHVFPDLDFSAQATKSVGNHTTLRASIDGTASAEADDYLTGTATVGAHYANGDFWADASGRYDSDDKWRTSLKSGYANPTTSFRWTAALDTTFGDNVARGDASGRGTASVDFGQDLKFDGATGYWGAYVGASADTDLRNHGAEAGVVFRLTW